MTPDHRPEISPLLVPKVYRVIDKVVEIDAPGEADVVTLHAVPLDGELPTFRPAQVAMVGTFGLGEAAISISSATDNRAYHAYTIRRAGPITGALIDTPVGGAITIRGPFGVPWPIDRITTVGLAIIGGGLGIAPLRAAAEEAVAARDRFERVSVFYGAKRPDLIVYRPDLARWRDQGADVAVTVDKGDETWDGPVGLVPDLLAADIDGHPDLAWADTTAFVCGPDVMMHFTAQKLIDLGVPPEQIWLTLERNMQCGNALCGHCQLGPVIICRDGPVVNYAEVGRFHPVPEL